MTPPNRSRKHSVVLGAGMAGLLAARVISNFYETVTIVERDPLSSDPVQRKGIPQGRHVHAFTSGGSHMLGRLFPGLLDELVDAGANVWDDGDLSRICFRFGGYEFKNSGRFADPVASATYLASRPFLEAHVRRRVRAIDNVLILDGHDVVAPVADTPVCVTGVRVVNRETGDATVLNAQLVVDAMGRGASTPAFLDSLGYGRPAEQRSGTRVVYASQLMRIPPDLAGKPAHRRIRCHFRPASTPPCALAVKAVAAAADELVDGEDHDRGRERHRHRRNGFPGTQFHCLPESAARPKVSCACGRGELAAAPHLPFELRSDLAASRNTKYRRFAEKLMGTLIRDSPTHETGQPSCLT
jgi:2-polyprenyl-6-methoxyphenol hydroxylase-like FAD-dependent oxidoreductase